MTDVEERTQRAITLTREFLIDLTANPKQSETLIAFAAGKVTPVQIEDAIFDVLEYLKNTREDNEEVKNRG